jgi:hypothetical protein
MPTYKSVNGTLAASVVSTVTIDTNGDDFQIENLDSSPDFSVIYVTVDGSVPTVAGNGCFAVSGTRVFANNTGRRSVTVKLICTSPVAYNVSACVTS